MNDCKHNHSHAHEHEYSHEHGDLHTHNHNHNHNHMKINTAIKISKKCMRIVKENICFAIGIKFAVLLLGAFGIATLWEAVFADVGVTIIAVLNAMRCMRLGR